MINVIVINIIIDIIISISFINIFISMILSSLIIIILTTSPSSQTPLPSTNLHNKITTSSPVTPKFLSSPSLQLLYDDLLIFRANIAPNLYTLSTLRNRNVTTLKALFKDVNITINHTESGEVSNVFAVLIHQL